MKILKRTKAMKDAHIAHGIRSFLTHFKIRERIDRMNQWAHHHRHPNPIAHSWQLADIQL